VNVETLSDRALNRATLARQLLLERADLPVLSAIEHLVGLQAQEPPDPYLALWSRLAGFRADELAELLVDRAVVRIVLMRSTIHLVTAADCLQLRPVMQPVIDAELARHPQYAPALRGLDLAPMLAFAAPLLAERPLSGRELRAALQERFPDLDAGALAAACRNKLALVQVPPRGVWGQSGQVRVTTAEAWLGRPLTDRPSVDDAVLRYLGAFGPATVADVSAWSRLTGMRAVVDRLRSRLRTFRDERGRELFDLPDAPRPDPDTSAPVRFLPEYDNVVLSHADRSRFHRDGRRPDWSGPDGRVLGSVLHDGVLAALWQIDGRRGGRTLTVNHLPGLSSRALAAIEAEGRRMRRFAHPDAGADVRLVPLS
jgi:hypothetical protein